MTKRLGAARALIASAALSALALLTGPTPSARADWNLHYLALGDSVAFGSDPLLDFHNASNFIGYPSPVAAALEERLTNPACPGETTSHFISLTGIDRGCGPYRKFFPLHTGYAKVAADGETSILANSSFVADGA